MKARRLMVQGTTSSAGKSLLVTALCRIFSRRGLRVAPFKSQNMSLNSHVTREGLEIGRAQAVQAEASGVEPSADMNPVLLKPSADHTSQVIVMGKVRASMDARAYYDFRHTLKHEVQAAFDGLAARYDLILIEGAGSPAEINLRKNDIANMGMAEMADAPVLLVGDIDRGGVFAALYGTVALLPSEEQKRIRAFVVNKFRGDLSLLEPGLRQLESMLARPVLGVLPYWDVRIDEEDSLTERMVRPPAPRERTLLDIVVVRLPRMANFTDFAVFDTIPEIGLRYAEAASQVGEPDLLILPGSKNTLGDMRFMRESGFADTIVRLAGKKIPIIGICGGYQMLGRVLRDPYGTESDIGALAGLGLLDMETVLATEKRTVRSCLQLHDSGLPGLLQGVHGMRLKGYEIHMGRTSGPALARSLGRLDQGTPEGAVNSDGTVFGCYLHGLFDNIPFTLCLLNSLLVRKRLSPLAVTDRSHDDFRQQEYDRLADLVEKHLDMAGLERIIEGK